MIYYYWVKPKPIQNSRNRTVGRKIKAKPNWKANLYETTEKTKSTQLRRPEAEPKSPISKAKPESESIRVFSGIEKSHKDR